MKKIDVLCWGVKHVAANHNFEPNLDDLENGYICLWGGSNVPTLSDMQMLCDDLGIGRENINKDDFGIGIDIPADWDKDSEYEESGMELWKRRGVAIGS